MLLPSAIAAFLGCWQVSRYNWKVDLLERREQGLKADPVDILSVPHTPVEYSRVAAVGEYQHDKSIYVGPRPRTVMGTAIPGFTLITPLVSKDWSRAVLVSRGWVPAEWKANPKLRALNSPTGKVEVTGVVRASEPRSGFVPNNEPAKGQWYWIDTPSMAAWCGLDPETPLVEVYSDEVAGEETGPVPTSMDVLAFKGRKLQPPVLYPLPKPAQELMRASVTPTDHRNYALTWFSLSAATAFLALRVIRRTPTRPKRGIAGGSRS